MICKGKIEGMRKICYNKQKMVLFISYEAAFSMANILPKNSRRLFWGRICKWFFCVYSHEKGKSVVFYEYRE